MFAYCRNNAVRRIDISGFKDQDAADLNEEVLEDGEILGIQEGGGDGSNSKAPSSGTSFPSFGALKRFLGSAGENKHWHHVVEQCQTTKSGFTSEQINNTSNVVAVDAQIHAQITGYYNSTKFHFTGGQSVRNWLAGQPFQVQFDFGMNVIRTS